MIRRLWAALAWGSLLVPACPAADDPAVEFPGPAAAREAIVDDRAEPYFSLLRPHDMSAKTGSPIAGDTPEARLAECRRRYQDAVLEFTDAEKEFVRLVVARFHPALSADYPRMAALPWSFLKVRDTIEGGLAHTRGRHIVLSPPVLDGIERLRKRSAEAAVQRAAGLFVHEQVHVFQRANPRAFDPLYVGVWGFRRAPRIEGADALGAVEVVNPDATDLGWVFPVRKGGGVRWIWPRVLFRGEKPAEGAVHRMPEDFRMAAVDVEETKEGFRLKRDAGGKPVVGELMEVPEYVRVFAGSSNIYHPIEAAADLLGTVFMVDAFNPKDRLSKGARESAEAALGPLRRWFRQHLR